VWLDAVALRCRAGGRTGRRGRRRVAAVPHPCHAEPADDGAEERAGLGRRWCARFSRSAMPSSRGRSRRASSSSSPRAGPRPLAFWPTPSKTCWPSRRSPRSTGGRYGRTTRSSGATSPSTASSSRRRCRCPCRSRGRTGGSRRALRRDHRRVPRGARTPLARTWPAAREASPTALAAGRAVDGAAALLQDHIGSHRRPFTHDRTAPARRS
jgi:hypothetical protein